MMEDILLVEAVERYLRGELSPEENAYFEKLRKETPEVDQLVVEHAIFLHQIESYGSTRDFKHQLHNTHNELLDKGEINESPAIESGKLLRMWAKYKKVVAIAASIAGVTALFISALVTYFTPVNDQGALKALGRQIQDIKHNLNVQSLKINDISTKVPQNERPVSGGTSFLIDGSGYLITNSHVIKGSSTIVVQNSTGQEYKAVIAFIDEVKDLAILHIEDEDFKSIGTLPYSIRKSNVDLGEQIFTLGYPRDEIVYNEGYLSAKTGFNNDTVTCQIAVSANPGNSGGPVLNKNGEVIGILSTAQQNAEGVVFAIKSKNIFSAVDGLRASDTASFKLKLPYVSATKGMNRVQQIKKIEDCVFMVRTYSK